MKCADPISTAEVAFQCLKQSAKSLRSTLRNRKDPCELGDFALAGADPAGALHACSCGQFASEIRQPLLERGFAQLRRVGIKIPEPLDLLLDDPALFWSCLFLCFCLPLRLDGNVLLSISRKLTSARFLVRPQTNDQWLAANRALSLLSEEKSLASKSALTPSMSHASTTPS
jgi:hypothetical protein